MPEETTAPEKSASEIQFEAAQARLLELRKADKEQRQIKGPTWRGERDDETYTEEEVATLLKVTRQTLINWRKKKIAPPSMKISRSIRYSKTKLQAWMDEKSA